MKHKSKRAELAKKARKNAQSVIAKLLHSRPQDHALFLRSTTEAIGRFDNEYLQHHFGVNLDDSVVAEDQTGVFASRAFVRGEYICCASLTYLPSHLATGDRRFQFKLAGPYRGVVIDATKVFNTNFVRYINSAYKTEYTPNVEAVMKGPLLCVIVVADEIDVDDELLLNYKWYTT